MIATGGQRPSSDLTPPPHQPKTLSTPNLNSAYGLDLLSPLYSYYNSISSTHVSVWYHVKFKLSNSAGFTINLFYKITYS